MKIVKFWLIFSVLFASSLCAQTIATDNAKAADPSRSSRVDMVLRNLPDANSELTFKYFSRSANSTMAIYDVKIRPNVKFPHPTTITVVVTQFDSDAAVQEGLSQRSRYSQVPPSSEFEFQGKPLYKWGQGTHILGASGLFTVDVFTSNEDARGWVERRFSMIGDHLLSTSKTVAELQR